MNFSRIFMSVALSALFLACGSNNKDKSNKDLEIKTLKHEVEELNNQKISMSSAIIEEQNKQKEIEKLNQNKDIEIKLLQEKNESKTEEMKKMQIDLESQIKVKEQELVAALQNGTLTTEDHEQLKRDLNELKVKLEKSKNDIQNALKQKQELEKTLALKQQELNKATSNLNDLALKRKYIDNFIRTSFSEFRGLWVVDEGDGSDIDINQSKCKIFMRVDSSKMLLSRIIYCEDNKSQIDTYSFSGMVPQYDSKTLRNSLSMTLEKDSSSCGEKQTHLKESKTVLFLDNKAADNSDRIGSYAALMFGDKAAYLNSGSNIPALLRTSNCEIIIKSAADNSDSKFLQLAAGACAIESDSRGSGCFIATNNFVRVN